MPSAHTSTLVALCVACVAAAAVRPVHAVPQDAVQRAAASRPHDAAGALCESAPDTRAVGDRTLWLLADFDTTETGPVVNLSWRRPGIGMLRPGPVTVCRNGTPLVVTRNDGTFVDFISPATRGTLVYQVCQAGASRCSNIAVADVR